MSAARDKQLGEIAVREGIATAAQVEECLAIREKLVKAGAQARSLPELLLAKQYVSREAARRLVELAAEAGIDDTPPPEIPGFEILGLLGRGGMGAVYKARQLSLDRIVALKVLSPEAARDETYVRRFTTEARALARLNHENIIAGIDVGESNGARYFAMEYVEGEPLSKTIEREGALPEKRALKIGIQIARALAHAEKNGLVHRDVKPQNIMLGKNDVAKLCDLGLAMTAEEQKEARDRGQSIGTPHYISPEQARGEHKVDIRSDIYSLGATLYHASTGETPFSGGSPMVLMTKHLTEEPPPPRKRRPGLSRAFNDLVVKMMAKEKEKRYQSPIELIEDMERVIAGRGLGAGGSPPSSGTGSGRAPNASTPRGGSTAVAAPRATRRPAGRSAVAAAPAARRGGEGEGNGAEPAVLSVDPRRRYAPQPASMTPLIVAVGVLLFGGIGAFLVYKGAQESAARQGPPPPSPEFEANARESLANVTSAFNAGRIDKYEAIQKLIEISRSFPRTEAGAAAAEYAKKIQAAPVKRQDEAEDAE